MLRFVFLIIFTIILVVFATTNAAPVSIQIAGSYLEVPLTYIIFLPVGIALLTFAAFYLLKSRNLKVMIHTIENEKESVQSDVTKLTKKNHELEIENKKLKTRLGIKANDDESL